MLRTGSAATTAESQATRLGLQLCGCDSRLYPPSSPSWDYGVASSNHSCIVTGL